ncbi:hypothetical protein ABK040_015174 [Willaertia magna]
MFRSNLGKAILIFLLVSYLLFSLFYLIPTFFTKYKNNSTFQQITIPSSSPNPPSQIKTKIISGKGNQLNHIELLLNDWSVENLKLKNSIPNLLNTPQLVTATSVDYFDRLENFIGSVDKIYNTGQPEIIKEIIKLLKNINPSSISSTNTLQQLNLQLNKLEKTRTTLIFNLGLNPEQKEKVLTWKNVIFVDFPFHLFTSNYPHVLQLGNFSWKPLVMYLSLQSFHSIIFLDSGSELINSLKSVELILKEKNYFYVAQQGKYTGGICCGELNELTHEATFQYLSLNKNDFKGKLMCAGGIQGYERNSLAFHKVLIPTIECALVENCITPKASNLGNHRQDQSVFSIFINKEGLTCEKDARFWATPGNIATYFNTEQLFKEKVVINLRKQLLPKPYVPYIVKRKKFLLIVMWIELMKNDKDSLKKELYKSIDNLFDKVCSKRDIQQTKLFDFESKQLLQQEEEKVIDLKFINVEKSQQQAINQEELREIIINKLKEKNSLKCFTNISFEKKEEKIDNNNMKELMKEQITREKEKYDYLFTLGKNDLLIRRFWLDALVSLIINQSKQFPDWWIIDNRIFSLNNNAINFLTQFYDEIVKDSNNNGLQQFIGEDWYNFLMINIFRNYFLQNKFIVTKSSIDFGMNLQEIDYLLSETYFIKSD